MSITTYGILLTWDYENKPKKNNKEKPNPLKQ